MCFQFKMKSCVNSDSVIWVGCLAVVSAFSDVASCVATLLTSLHHFTACCNWAACSLKGNVGLRIQLADTGAKFHQLSVTDYRSNCQDHGSVSEDRKSNETLEFNVNLNSTMRPNYSWSKVYYRSRGNSVTIFKMKATRLEMELWCVELDHQEVSCFLTLTGFLLVAKEELDGDTVAAFIEHLHGLHLQLGRDFPGIRWDLICGRSTHRAYQFQAFTRRGWQPSGHRVSWSVKRFSKRNVWQMFGCTANLKTRI